jgi:hypothetical protein
MTLPRKKALIISDLRLPISDCSAAAICKYSNVFVVVTTSYQLSASLQPELFLFHILNNVVNGFA